MGKWFTSNQLITLFKPIPAGGYATSSAKFAYTGLNKLTQAEKDANFAKFMADFQTQIEATWAKGSCSKAETYKIVENLCPFG